MSVQYWISLGLAPTVSSQTLVREAEVRLHELLVEVGSMLGVTSETMVIIPIMPARLFVECYELALRLFVSILRAPR